MVANFRNKRDNESENENSRPPSSNKKGFLNDVFKYMSKYN